MVKDYTNRQGGGGQKLSKLRRKSGGVIALEVCFTLPVVVYLIFFTIELIKMNITQDALQSICEEATYLTIAHDYSSGQDLRDKIDAIIEKYRPVFIPAKAVCSAYGSVKYPVIRWVFETASSLDELFAKAPYGGTSIVYPAYEKDEVPRMHAESWYGKNVSRYIPINNEAWPVTCGHWEDTVRYLKSTTDGLPTGRVFVITITCNYPFSNSLVKWLFNGGSNTKIWGTSNDGGLYLLWARGAGIVNAK